MAIKKWLLKQADESQVRNLTAHSDLTPFLAHILSARGLGTLEKASAFLSDEVQPSDPFLMADMQLAVERVRAAIDGGESIAVYGDYDCDGVTSTAMLYHYLSFAGAQVGYYIPDREKEGYGLNRNAVDRLHAGGIQLIITVDNGISSLDEAAYAKSLGIDLVITDHHQPGDTLPDACAVVNPHRLDCPCPFKELAGVGVAFKLITALEDGDYTSMLEQYGDLLAVGTIGDVVPLIGENRFFVRKGLETLHYTERPGLIALMENAGIHPTDVDARTVAFSIVPRINATGRMSSASEAVDLLLSEDDEEAAEKARKIGAYNSKRQAVEQEILSQILSSLEAAPRKLDKRFLVACGKDWHPGVIGIVSARLLDRFGKPNMVLTDEGGIARGSARSVDGFPLYPAIKACSDLLTRFGGHAKAAGVTLRTSNVPAFETAMLQYAREMYDVMPQPVLELDKSLRASDLSLEAVRQLGILEPCGERNPSPVFLMPNALIRGVYPVSEGKHTRLKLSFDSESFYAICFGMPTPDFPFPVNSRVDLAVSLEINHYNGQESVSIKVRDIRCAGFDQDAFFSAKGVYEKLWNGEKLSPRVYQKITPSRSELGTLYKALSALGNVRGDVDMLYMRLSGNVNFCKFRLMLDILKELELIHPSPLFDAISVPQATVKKDLSASRILARLCRNAQA